MVIGELVGFEIEFPAQRFFVLFLPCFFFTGIVSNGRASRAKSKAGRAEGGRGKKKKRKGGAENINAGTGPGKSCQCEAECGATYGDV